MESTISTHTPLAGRDRNLLSGPSWMSDFYSHAPRGARPMLSGLPRTWSDFYSHAPRGARPASRKILTSHSGFLLTRPSRGATNFFKNRKRLFCISTHTPLAGRDGGSGKLLRTHVEFLLTRPSRGATGVDDGKGGIMYDFYSHAPRGARLNPRMRSVLNSIISTHTPLAGRDAGMVRVPLDGCISTHTPLAGRDSVVGWGIQPKPISTHTPLAGRDQYGRGIRRCHADFYSHAPRGARQNVSVDDSVITDFYSHSPRGARPMRYLPLLGVA